MWLARLKLKSGTCDTQRILSSDSVEEGDKLVKTAIDNFGRLGELCTSRLINIDQN